MPHPIYYDTETTGVKPDKDRIVEIAAFNALTGETFVQFINPGCPIPPEVSAITHITDEMVASSPSFEVVGQNFIDFCGKDAILIAHNNDRFDKLFLVAESARSSLTLPAWGYIDTLKWARKYRPDLPGHSLQLLREVYGIAANQAHRALDDVHVLYQVFSNMIDDLSIETVVQLLSEPAKVASMPFGKYQGRALADVPASYVKWLKETGAFDKSENRELKEGFEKAGLLKIGS